MNDLAKDLGVKVDFVPADWKTLVKGVVAGKYYLMGSASISLSPPVKKPTVSMVTKASSSRVLW